MEVVNTLDIDGTQWNIQDSEARNGISELKSKIKYEIVITEEIFNSDIEINKKTVLYPAYYNIISVNNRPTTDAILFQAIQSTEVYQGLIISIMGNTNSLLLSSESQMKITKGFKLTYFWLKPITE